MMKDGRVDFDFSNVYKVTGDPSSSIANGSITDVVSNYWIYIFDCRFSLKYGLLFLTVTLNSK